MRVSADSSPRGPEQRKVQKLARKGKEDPFRKLDTPSLSEEFTVEAAAYMTKLEQEFFEKNPFTPGLNLSAYIQAFGKDPETITATELATFRLAKRLEAEIDDLKIPMAKRVAASDKKILVEEEVESIIEKTSYKEGRAPSKTPANDMDVAFNEESHQIPDLLPSEWALEEFDEDLFFKRIVAREALARQWQIPTHTPVTTYETVKETRLVERPAPEEYEKQHAFVLLDKSRSMDHRKERVAKGLSVAFLKKGREDRAQLNLKPFDYRTHAFDVLQAKSEDEFQELLTNLISIRMNGRGTDIQGALAAAVRDIKSGGEFDRADILLITDGLSMLDYNPLGDVKLHTFVLQSESDLGYMDRKERETASENLRTLRSWSSSFKVLAYEDIARLHTLSREDVELLEGVIRSIPDRARQIISPERLDDLQREIEMLEEELEAYKLYQENYSVRGNVEDGRLEQTEALLEQIKAQQEAGVFEEMMEANKARMHQKFQEHMEELGQQQREDVAQARQSLESLTRHLGGNTDSSSSKSTSPGGGAQQQPKPQNSEQKKESMTLWEKIKTWFQGIWN